MSTADRYAGRGGGHGVSWFVIGFLAGVAATLAVLIYAYDRPVRQAEAAPAPPVVTYTPPRLAPRPRAIEAPPASAAPAAVPAAPVPPPVVDEQVQEDAAATGMTSRAQPPAQDLH